jgi:hypothetical protein
MQMERLPEAWAASSPWTHRTRRAWVGWLPRRLRLARWFVMLPRSWRSYLCATEAPAHLCRCGLYSIRWGYSTALEEMDDEPGT